MQLGIGFHRGARAGAGAGRGQVTEAHDLRAVEALVAHGHELVLRPQYELGPRFRELRCGNGRVAMRGVLTYVHSGTLTQHARTS